MTNGGGARRLRQAKAVAAIVGALLGGGVASAVTLWTVGLGAGSKGEAQASLATNVTISAVATPAPGGTLYPGGAGDVVLTITNPNTFPVTITKLDLPSSATDATGYSDSALTSPVGGCTSSGGTASLVTWTAAASPGDLHTLTTALVVAASGQASDPLTVTLTGEASMNLSSPLACEGAYFAMPSLTGITATGGAATATTSPAADTYATGVG